MDDNDLIDPNKPFYSTNKQNNIQTLQTHTTVSSQLTLQRQDVAT